MRSDIAEALQPPPEWPGPQTRSGNRFCKCKSTRGQKVCAQKPLESSRCLPRFLLPDAVRVRLDIESVGSPFTGASHAQIASSEDLEMRTTFDFAPYRRSTVGFARLFNLLEAGAREDDGYPPFAILKDGAASYRITTSADPT